MQHAHRTCSEAGCAPLTGHPVVNHCSGCHVTFGTLELFDAHQHWAGRPLELTCDTPAELGLEQDDHGTWQTPEGLRARWRATRDLLAARRQQAATRGPVVNVETRTDPPRYDQVPPAAEGSESRSGPRRPTTRKDTP